MEDEEREMGRERTRPVEEIKTRKKRKERQERKKKKKGNRIHVDSFVLNTKVSFLLIPLSPYHPMYRFGVLNMAILCGPILLSYYSNFREIIKTIKQNK